jgi:hypothetical protein
MHIRIRTATAATTALLAITLVGCSNDSGDDKAAAASKSLTARSAFQKISAAVPSAKLTGTVTAENDPNHLLGRPSQYTSKITFSDSRISASDVSGTEKGDVGRGGSIEVFASAADAKARAEYIQSVTKSLPALTEYDYIHGTMLVRVSHYLAPKQASEYKSAAATLG